jgi:NADH:ubiquinone oxidoreductase subunit 6 (subunit J)
MGLFSWVKRKVVNNAGKLLFWTVVTTVGPGAIVATVGMEGLAVAGIVVYSGAIGMLV